MTISTLATCVIGAGVVQFITTDVFSARHGRIALGIGIANGRLIAAIGLGRPGTTWLRFYEERFKNGQLNGYFDVVNDGGGVQADFLHVSFDIKYSVAPLTSPTLGFSHQLIRKGGTTLSVFKLPPWPLLIPVGLISLRLFLRRTPSNGFDVIVPREGESGDRGDRAKEIDKARGLEGV